jgi:5-formyltetrahydrofolate cyclo-ligase
VNKYQIRNKILKIRKSNSKNISLDYESVLRILNNKKMKSKVIGGYYPYNYEVDGMKILKKLEQQKYIISLPKIKKNYQMDFFEWSIKDPLKINKYGIPEPISNKVRYPDILFVPLVAFDKYLNRIGYGGGFYDRYISKIRKKKNVLLIGLAYSFQKVNKIPINKYDIKLDFIITEKKN